MGSIIILTGPAGVGKSTIAKLVAEKRTRCAVIDVDMVRWMLLEPHAAPWDGEEGIHQQKLGVQNACTLAQQFLKDECYVLIHDVVTNDTLGMYRDILKEHKPHVVILLPTFAKIEERNKERPPRLKDEEIKLLYHWQKELLGYDSKIDNTLLSAEEVAEQINGILS